MVLPARSRKAGAALSPSIMNQGLGPLLRIVVWACLVARCSAIFAPFDPDQPPAYCTVYTHLVKSGGTSLKDQLQRESVRQGMPKPGLCTSDGRTTADMCLAALHGSTIIMGYGEELRNSLYDEGRQCEYFTMMRHPVDRALSAFYYCPKDHDVQSKRPAKWCGNAEGLTKPITERFVEFVGHMFRNSAYQSLYRSMICYPNFALCKPEHQRESASRPTSLDTKEGMEVLEKVEDILLSYNAVGIFEHWELSMQLFDARVKSPVEHWDADVSKNPGEQSMEREALKQWAHNSPEVHNLLSADMHIYSYAMSLFKEQTSSSLGTVWE
ncbi:unnamed protein product [Scytosiphon promiscuus]